MIRAAAVLVLALGVPGAFATDLPGKGPASTECFAILRSDGATPASAPNRLECTNGDPGCDHDGDCHDDGCTFRVRVCINQAVAGCQAPAALKSLKINPPKLGIGAPASLTGAVCGDPTDVVVPLHGKQKTKPGKQVIAFKAKPDGGKGVDADKVTLVCLPRPATDPCPTTTTTTTTLATTTTTVVGATTTTAIGTTTTTATEPTTTTTGGATTTTAIGSTTTTGIETTTTTGIGTTTTTGIETTTTTSGGGTTTTTMGGATCAPLVDDAQGIAGTYSLTAVGGPTLCQTNAQTNRFGPCSTEEDCGGTTGTTALCSTTPFATADGVVLPFPQGIKTTFTIAEEDTTACDHTACISCGNADGICPGITGCGSTPGQPANGCLRNQCCDQPGFSIPTFLVPLLGGLCSRLDQYRCGFGAVNSSNPQTGDNEVTKTADTSDPGPDCEYGTPDDPAAKPCNTGGTGEGNDGAGKVVRTVGNGQPDVAGIHYRLAVPSVSTTWQDAQSPAGECDQGSTFDDGELLVTQLVLNAEFTTAGATGSFADLNGDGCARAGAGFTNFNRNGPFTLGSPPAMPQPYDASSCTPDSVCSVAVAAGVALTGGGPLFDVGFIAVLPNGPITRAPAESCSCTQSTGCPE